VPGQTSDGPSKPPQFTLTTLQPQWRETNDNALVWGWQYCIPHRLWCLIRSLFGEWAICGTVELCETGQAVGGVRVRAFNLDWLQDDPLGDGITDGNGRFRIDYSAEDFRPDTFIDVELFGGPDLYFRVETLGGVSLLVEPAARGRDPDGENVGPCFCVDLYIDEMPEGQTEPPPVFPRIGGFDYATDIDSLPAGTWLTVGSGRAFFNVNRLNGVLPKTLNGNPMEYRFEIRELTATGVPITPWTTVMPG